MDAREALEIAHRSESATKPYQDVEDAEGRQLGVLVSVAPDDYGKDRTVGELVVSSLHEVAVRRRDPRVGEVVIHFPRIGFQVLPVGGRLARLRRFAREAVPAVARTRRSEVEAAPSIPRGGGRGS